MEESLVQETVEPDEEVEDSNSNINATTEGVSPSSLPEGENFKELTADDVVGREFPTVEDAERWYRMYGTAIGFGVRKQRVTRGIEGRVTRRRMVCCKEGKRDAKWLEKEDRVRNPRNETRENCLAACCFHYNKDSGTDSVYNNDIVQQQMKILSTYQVLAMILLWAEQRDPEAGQYWRHLWKLKVPPKMVHFLWRCSMGFIPM
ncbi:hypothetical protein ABKV19_003882 [Rosa sericea]